MSIFWLMSTDAGFPCAGDISITAVADMEKLEGCPTYSGNIQIHSMTPTATGSNNASMALVLPSVETVIGSLEFADFDSNGTNRYSISAPISSITGNLTFQNLMLATMPDFPHLTSARSITFENVDFTTPSPFTWGELVASYAISFVTTGVTQIGPFGEPPRDFVFSEIPDYNASNHTYITAVNNPNLNLIDLSGYWDLITNVNISNNSPTSHFNLWKTRKGILHLKGVQKFNAPDLTVLEASGDLDLAPPQAISNNSFSELFLPSLQSVQQTLEIDGNGELTNFSLPELASVDAMRIWNNSRLNDVDLSGLSSVSDLTISAPLNKYGCSVVSYTWAHLG